MAGVLSPASLFCDFALTLREPVFRQHAQHFAAIGEFDFTDGQPAGSLISNSAKLASGSAQISSATCVPPCATRIIQGVCR
jgi:hypothetical protein